MTMNTLMDRWLAHIVERLDLDLDLVLVIAGWIDLDALLAVLLLLLGNDLIPALADGGGGCGGCRGCGLVGALLLALIVLAIDQQLRLEGVFANVLILVRVAVVKHEASEMHTNEVPYSKLRLQQSQS